MASKRNVGGDTVRTWAIENGVTVGARGRFSAETIKAFEKANKGLRYMPNFVETRKITGTREGSNGRKQTVTVSATLTEVREWAASPEGIAAGVTVGSRGRIGKDTLAAFAARPKV